MDDQLTKEIINAAYTVHNQMGFGYLEKVYENALVIELKKRGFEVKQQFPVKVFYDEQIVGGFVADLFINEKLILELKAVTKIRPEHELQLVNYLKGTDKPVGLLINFGQSVQVKRKYRDYRPPTQKLYHWVNALVNLLPF